jgi:hypothetical protein
VIKVTEIRRDAASLVFEVRVFEVRVDEGGTETTHEVTLKLKDMAKLAHEQETPARFIERCFAFLLERESNTSILRRFDISVIGMYFPEFEKTIQS